MIRRAYRRFYGPAWRRFRAAMIAAHGNRCSICGRVIEKYLNLAHTQHNPRTSPVALMCPTDHARHDARHSYAVRRRNWAKRFGQRWLWPEVGEDPSHTPARRDPPQERLF